MTFTPAAAKAYAVAQPVKPPPTTTTSVFVAPRYRGWAGTRDLGNRSIQGEWPYLVGIGRTLYRAGWAGPAGWAGWAGRAGWGRTLPCLVSRYRRLLPSCPSRPS